MLEGYSLGWLIMCFAVGYFAKGKGRNGIAWGIGAFFFSPILAGIILAVLKDKKLKEQVEQVSMEQQQLKDRVAMGEISNNKKIQAVEQSLGRLETNNGTLESPVQQDLISGGSICPNCGKIIKQDAVKCRYCGCAVEKKAMVECPFCKELIRADATKCKYCRSEITPSTKIERANMIECPSCKELVSADAKFCEFCGNKLA